MFWLKLAGKILQFAGGIVLLISSRWLLMPASYKEDIRETKIMARVLRWNIISLGNWLDMLPYRLMVLASHELGIAQHNLKKLRAKYERGEFASDSIASSAAGDSPNEQNTNADRLDSSEQNAGN